MGFVLHPRLAEGAFEIARLPLCLALLKDDARWPWLILAPRAPDLRELHDLSTEDAAILMQETRLCTAAVAALPGVAKVNVGAIGNQVEQLHVHIVGRSPLDPAWPDPVWGKSGKVAYTTEAREALVFKLAAALTPPAQAP